MSDEAKPLPTPDRWASFKETDAWLRDRGWVLDGLAWISRTSRVTIASYQEAQKIQRRRDTRANRGVSGNEREAVK